MTRTTATGAAIAAALALAVPGSAQAHDHGRHGRSATSGLPARVAAPLVRAERALARAEERVEDGEADRAVTALTAVRRNLAAALKATRRRLSGDDGPDAATALAGVQHDVVTEVANLYDGQDGTVVTALNTTLGAAVDGRDDLGTAVSALGDEALPDFEELLAAVADDTEDELAGLQEVREDDTVTADGDAALAQALTRVAATREAAEARLAALDEGDDDAGYDDWGDEDEDDDGGWRHGHHRHGAGFDEDDPAGV